MSSPSVRIIALETSGTQGSVAALVGCNELLLQELDHEQRSARSLAPTVRRVLADVGWRPTDIELVAVTLGPGSFTGLRVGIATAKTLAYTLGANLVGVNTLEALAERVPREAERLFTVIDAGRQELYVGEFLPGDSDWRPIGAGRIESIETWLAGLQPGATVTGPALAKLVERLPAHVTPAAVSTWKLMANAVGQVAWRYYQAGRRDDPFGLVPFYLRRSAAEEKADGAQHQFKKSGK